MFVSIMETARNSTFRNPFLTTVNCDSDAASTSNGTKTLVAGRTIAAAATAEGGKQILIDLPVYKTNGLMD